MNDLTSTQAVPILDDTLPRHGSARAGGPGTSFISAAQLLLAVSL
jgi:hypothetical protein